MFKDKFLNFKDKTLFDYVDFKNQKFIENLFLQYNFSFQEFCLICEISIDFNMWEQMPFFSLWNIFEKKILIKDNRAKKKQIIKLIKDKYEEIKTFAKDYKENKTKNNNLQKKEKKIKYKVSNNNILGLCPVASDKTVCCLLRTLDVVEKCAYECSYCCIDTFYNNEIIFNNNLLEKLRSLKIDSNKFYHIGTGQSSDSLYWGNKNGILDDLCKFANENPNILLEFKTKSDNVEYFIKNNKKNITNIICTWTLNTDVIIQNEEFSTSDLTSRINAARKVSDQGIKIGFHFHPIVYYKNWEKDYLEIIQLLQKKFNYKEISFISFGSVTFIKPIIKNIRKKNIKGIKTKILQMPMIHDPHGKLTYPDEIKINQFKKIYEAFKPWHEKIFFYLCMEKHEIWKQVFGFCYKNNKEFEMSFKNFLEV